MKLPGSISIITTIINWIPSGPERERLFQNLETFIESRERKAFKWGQEQARAYMCEQDLVLTIDGSFNDYKNSPEYLSEEK